MHIGFHANVEKLHIAVLTTEVLTRHRYCFQTKSMVDAGCQLLLCHCMDSVCDGRSMVQKTYLHRCQCKLLHSFIVIESTVWYCWIFTDGIIPGDLILRVFFRVLTLSFSSHRIGGDSAFYQSAV